MFECHHRQDNFASKISGIKFFYFFLIHFQQANVWIFFNSVSKSVFVIKFACANLALKTLAAKVLNYGVVMYLS